MSAERSVSQDGTNMWRRRRSTSVWLHLDDLLVRETWIEEAANGGMTTWTRDRSLGPWSWSSAG